MKARSLPASIVASISIVPLAGLAHHSVQGSFDTGSPFELRAIVEQIVWANPHAYLLVTSTSPDDDIEQWAVELGAPNSLVRNGFGRDTVVADDEILVAAFASRPGVSVGPQISGSESAQLASQLNEVIDRAAASRLVHAQRITLPDGRTLESAGEWRREF